MFFNLKDGITKRRKDRGLYSLVHSPMAVMARVGHVRSQELLLGSSLRVPRSWAILQYASPGAAGRLELASIWDAGAAGLGLTSYARAAAHVASFFPLLQCHFEGGCPLQ